MRAHVSVKSRSRRRRVAKPARSAARGLPARAIRFVKRNPVRVLVGTSLISFVLVKLGRLV